MLDLTHVTARRPDRSLADNLRGAALLALCLALASTFLADVGSGPALPGGPQPSAAAAPAACAGTC
ncbi:MAG TPA: hypothetical protein VMU15_06635 [Anaeromyxobacter sp.]|nr:hypothetical protein [Anaeromyxobacter sp.]